MINNGRRAPTEPTLAAWWRYKRTIAKLRWPVLRAAFAPEAEYQKARRTYDAAYRKAFGHGPGDAAEQNPGSSQP
ncbi:hypothetical protein [Catenulispora subtropica]|uniref:Uncharacterized protein n=1 Tax=Catenulispora subtropica TaxID=450798 RepID=A0ABP5CPK6_9ACTN